MAPHSSLAAVPASRPPATDAIRVLIAEGDEPTRRQIRALLQDDPEITVVAEAADERTALASAQHARPTVVVATRMLPDANARAARRRPGDPTARPRVLVVAPDAAPETVRDVLRAGAAGCLPRGALASELVAAVKTVARGRRFLSSAVQRLIVEECTRPTRTVRARDELARLTGRERQILQLVAEGRPRSEIARLLAVRPSTVDTHRQAIMAKLDLHRVAQLVRFAMRHGLVR